MVFAGCFSEGVPGLTFNRARISSKLSQHFIGVRRQRRLRIQQTAVTQASQTNSRNCLILTTTLHIVNRSTVHRRKKGSVQGFNLSEFQVANV
jgi:hypothetical protein